MATVPRICAWCKRALDPLSEAALKKLPPGTHQATHGICQQCAADFARAEKEMRPQPPLLPREQRQAQANMTQLFRVMSEACVLMNRLLLVFAAREAKKARTAGVRRERPWSVPKLPTWTQLRQFMTRVGGHAELNEKQFIPSAEAWAPKGKIWVDSNLHVVAVPYPKGSSVRQLEHLRQKMTPGLRKCSEEGCQVCSRNEGES